MVEIKMLGLIQIVVIPTNAELKIKSQNTRCKLVFLKMHLYLPRLAQQILKQPLFQTTNQVRGES